MDEQQNQTDKMESPVAVPPSTSHQPSGPVRKKRKKSKKKRKARSDKGKRKGPSKIIAPPAEITPPEYVDEDIVVESPPPVRVPSLRVDLARIAALVTPQFVESAVKLAYSHHGFFSSFCLWDLPIDSDAFMRKISERVSQASFLRYIDPALRRIFPDGLNHCAQQVAGVIVMWAVFEEVRTY